MDIYIIYDLLQFFVEIIRCCVGSAGKCRMANVSSYTEHASLHAMDIIKPYWQYPVCYISDLERPSTPSVCKWHQLSCLCSCLIAKHGFSISMYSFAFYIFGVIDINHYSFIENNYIVARGTCMQAQLNFQT